MNTRDFSFTSLTQPELLKSCWNYFNQAQLSWDKYFSKWEVMAKEENVDDFDKDKNLSFKETEDIISKKKKSVKSKRRTKSVPRTSKKRNKSKENLTNKRKKLHCKARNKERGNKIIHKTENQTNLECEVVNNKHFEADLKAIFIEILSENTNRVGMFSVLSRMFPGNGNTISNISLSSVIMERNEFSINPVNNIILHSSSYNEYIPRGISTGLSPSVPERKYSSPGFNSITENANGSGVHLCGINNLTFLNDSYVKHTRKLFHRENWLGETTHDTRDQAQVFGLFKTIKNEKPRRLEGKNTIGSTIYNGDSIYTNTQQSKTNVELSNQSMGNELSTLTSPKATLRNILSPNRIQSEPPRSYYQNRKRKKFNLIPYDSYDGSEDENDNCNGDGSHGRFLKIFCTPTRPRRCINSKTNDSAAEDSNEEHCFDIVDRVNVQDVNSKDASNILKLTNAK